MTPNDDEALARLRAALHTIADRTPISGGRLNEVSVAAGEKRNRPVVTIVSAAAAVAAIAAVSAVVVGTHSNASRSIVPGAGGAESSTPTPIPSVIASPVPSPVASAVASPIASLAAPVVAPSPSTSCVPENYYVTASPSEVAGLTYMLPATPAGYVLYGAWGTISRNQCADSVTWYVEYDPASGTPGDGTNAYQVTVTKVDGDSTAGEFSSARPVASTPITVNGVEGYVFSKDGAYSVIGWTAGGAQISLAGPVSHGDIQSLVSVADSLVLLSPSDSRIVAPGNCQVPAGSVCGSDSPTPIATPSPSSTTAANAGPPESATPVPSPTPTG